MPTLNGVDGLSLNSLFSSANSTGAQCLKNNGISTIFAYITGSGAFTETELQNATDSGFNIFLSYETNPTYAAYFSTAQGTSDAQAAAQILYNLQVPPSLAPIIFFSVDYDAQAADEAQIINYFNAIVDYFDANSGGGNPYQVGIYGGYNPLLSVKDNCPGVVGFWQTYAWSNGYVHNFNTAYQYLNSQTMCGIGVDYNQVNSTVGTI